MPETSSSAHPGSESARYVLAGRALPALRHALVGELQALKFAASMARIASGAGRSDEAMAALGRLGESTDRSIARAQAMSSWLQPEADALADLTQAADECVELVRTQWRIRGLEINARVAAGSTPVRAWPFRELFAACLFALGDSLDGAHDIAVRVRRRAAVVLVTARVRPARREVDGPPATWPRPLWWTDVEALASVHSATCRRCGNRVSLRIPAQGAPSTDVR